MKYFLLLMLIFTIAISGYSQSSTNPNMKVETVDAYYAEGDQALSKFIFHNLKYSEEAKANKISGDVIVSFWVETDSSLSNIKVITDLGYGCSENLSALMKNIKFVPAKVNGVPMKSKVLATFPVRAH